MDAEDFKRLPPRYDGTAEEVAVEPIEMPNAMTVEGYIAGLGKMASNSLEPGRRNATARVFITALAISLVGGTIFGLWGTIQVAFGLGD